MENIILAAGYGTRSGGKKLFYTYRNRPLLAHTIDASLRAGLHTIIVLGAYEKRVRAILAAFPSPLLCPVVNRSYAKGQFSSTKCGAAVLSGTQDFFVTVGDLPGIEARHYALLAASIKETDDGVRPFFRGTPGHPVLLRAFLKNAITAADDGTSMHELLKNYRIAAYTADDPAFITDIDTAEDWLHFSNRWKSFRHGSPI